MAAESEHRAARALAIVAVAWVMGYWLWSPGGHRSLPDGTVPDLTLSGLEENLPHSPQNSASSRVPDASPVRIDRASDAAGSPAAQPSKPTRAPVTIHTVRPNDTLSGISLRYYGTVRHADLIYHANRDQLDDPDDLALGQRLVIPALETDPD